MADAFYCPNCLNGKNLYLFLLVYMLDNKKHLP